MVPLNHESGQQRQVEVPEPVVEYHKYERLSLNNENTNENNVANNEIQEQDETGDYEVPDEITIQPKNIDPNPILKQGKILIFMTKTI